MSVSSMMLLLLTSYSSPFSIHVNFPICWIRCNMSLALDFCVFVYGSTMSLISMAGPGHSRKDDDDDDGWDLSWDLHYEP